VDRLSMNLTSATHTATLAIGGEQAAKRVVDVLTEMFFEGEAGNERDFLYRNLDADDRRASTGKFGDRATGMEADAVVTVWDIVLRT
jgi:hypothetical protein